MLAWPAASVGKDEPARGTFAANACINKLASKQQTYSLDKEQAFCAMMQPAGFACNPQLPQPDVFEKMLQPDSA